MTTKAIVSNPLNEEVVTLHAHISCSTISLYIIHCINIKLRAQYSCK